MADKIDVAFERATQHVRRLKSLDDTTMLALYGLYKQATIGSCNTSKPGFWDLVGKSKWESWKKLGNMKMADAKVNYVELVEQISEDFDATSDDMEEEDEARQKSGMGVSVSTMAYGEEDLQISDENKTIFDWCKEGNTDRVSKLLSKKDFDVNSKDENGMTLLHWSCDRGHTKMVKMLIKCKTNINEQDNELQTPLHYAAVCEHDEIVKILVAKGADHQLKDIDELTPLQATSSKLIQDLLNKTDTTKS